MFSLPRNGKLTGGKQLHPENRVCTELAFFLTGNHFTNTLREASSNMFSTIRSTVVGLNHLDAWPFGTLFGELHNTDTNNSIKLRCMRSSSKPTIQGRPRYRLKYTAGELHEFLIISIQPYLAHRKQPGVEKYISLRTQIKGWIHQLKCVRSETFVYRS